MMRLLLALVAIVTAQTVWAHDGVIHKSDEEAAAHAAAVPAPSGLPFPVKLGGPFTLTDQNGAQRTQADPDGHKQLLFFGYANCQAICSVALPLMADVTDQLTAAGVPVTPVMITVDPERDRVDTLAEPLAQHHARFVGLTGDDSALQAAYDAYSIERSVVFEDLEYGPVYAHGSHIYLLDAEGTFLTLLPPILSADRVTEIVKAYH